MIIHPDVLPFAAQLIGNIFRLMGWTFEIHSQGNPSPGNMEIRQRMQTLNEKLNASPLGVVEDGRLRLEQSTDPKEIKVYMLLGNLKRQ